MIYLTILFAMLCVSITSASEVAPRIINGAIVPHMSWIAQIFYTLTTNKDDVVPAFCSGSLVSSNWVLTAKSCLQHDKAEFYIVVSTPSHTLGELIRVVEIQIDEDGSSSNDLALLKLDKDGEQNIEIQLKDNLNYDGRQARIYGWGRTGTGRFSRRLQATNVTLNGRDECDEHSVCFDPKRTNSNFCYGDTGGPMVTEENDEMVLIGVAPDAPMDTKCPMGERSSYISTSYFAEWIKKIIN